MQRGLRQKRDGKVIWPLPVVLLALAAFVAWGGGERGIEVPPDMIAVSAKPETNPSLREPALEGPTSLHAGDGSAEDAGLTSAPSEFVDGPAAEAPKLAAIHALCLDRYSGDPLRSTPCHITDANNVVVIGETDAKGLLRTDVLLSQGPIWLQYPDDRARRRLEQGTSIDLLAEGRDSQGNTFPGAGRVKLKIHKGLIHRGDAAEPDTWGVDVERTIALEAVAPGDLARRGFELTLVSADGSLASGGVVGARFDRFETPEWIRQSSLHHFALHGRFIDGWRSGSDWSRKRLHLHVPGRLLRAAMVTDDGILMAEADGATLPPWEERAIQLVFRPMTETEPDRIRALFARGIAARILSTMDLKERAQERETLAVATISGVVTSRSGGYQGRVRVIARPSAPRNAGTVPFPSGTGQVEWTEDATGTWFGKFKIEGLAGTNYRLQFKLAGDASFESNVVDAFAPRQFDEGELVVLDEITPPIR